MGEYSKYNVTELSQITLEDDEESMRTIATGWVNTGSVLGSANEALQERLESLRQVWTGPSFGAFEQFIHKTIANVEAAQTQADNRGDAAGKIASTAGWAKDSVKEQYDEYQKKKGESSDGITGVPLLGGVPGLISGPVVIPLPSDSPTNEEIRKPFDEQSRKIMKVALEEYQTQKPAMTQEVVRFQPIGEPDGIEDPGWVSPGDDGWGPDGTGGSNGSDTTTLSAASYGGNAIGPSLQSGGTAPATPVPSGGLPPAPTGGTPVFNGPPVAGLPPGSAKGPSAPPRLPTASNPGARNFSAPRSTGSAPRTPSPPAQRSGPSRTAPGANGGRKAPGANGRTASGANGRTGARGGSQPGRTGRGLPKSQMAPKDLTRRVRSSGEVIGRRGGNAKPGAANAKANPVTPRRVQPSVVRGAKSAVKQAGGKSPVDNTKRGFSSRVINSRVAGSHVRTPFVGEKMKHAAKPEPIGKRAEPETGRSKARREIEAFRAQRRKKLEQPDGLSRPVIGSGLTNTVDIDDVVPSQREAVKAQEALWQPQQGVVDPVIGKRRWDPDAVDHDPGPKAFDPRQAFREDLDARLEKSRDPGPTAFDPRRRPDTSTWPGGN